jgi:flagellar biosynthetic protein FlhB
MSNTDKESKTEDPTAKRKGEARKEGNIPRSQELVSWVAILFGFVMLEKTVANGVDFMHREMAKMAELISAPDERKALSFMVHSIGDGFILIAPLVLTFMVIGVIGHLAQVKFLFSTKTIKPNLKKLNPLTGFKRIFSMQSTFQLIKEVVKTVAFSLIAYFTLWETVMNISRSGPYSVHAIIGIVVGAVVTYIKYTAICGVLIGIADYMFNRRKINSTLKMTKQEVKDETKTQDLPPEVRGKIRSKQREMSRNRMMSMISQADVVVVNPVHIAMALKYDPLTGAPKVVAKGAGFVAEKIRDKAEESRVPIVQDIPLARALHKACDIDDEIPLGLFEAVAKLLAFVYSLKNRGASAGFHKMPGTPELEDVEANANAYDLLAPAT